MIAVNYQSRSRVRGAASSEASAAREAGSKRSKALGSTASSASKRAGHPGSKRSKALGSTASSAARVGKPARSSKAGSKRSKALGSTASSAAREAGSKAGSTPRAPTRPKDGARARTGSKAGGKLAGVVQYGPGEPWTSEGACGPKGRARSLWTAVVRFQDEKPAAYREMMAEFYGLKPRDSVLLESLLYDAQLTNRVQEVKRAGRVVARRVSIDPGDRWVLEVWA